ncbi:hypothetical protein E8P82_07445 [Arthrobacter echini]|uniref:Uncharacterized protein n=1 Tax=Arthrobacter echini TaxID=1529066 RepID=A0A4S5E5H6_9MICC|nr:hypothetical protein [Arthrobacter echini]THJ66764.1 hypothetical protein E8P82_07445 [Arthrobacter echini]
MCGACGRVVVADPTLGPRRTRRDLLVVAQVVNAVTSGLAGLPVVRVGGDSWVLVGRTGTSTACDTVGQLWEALAAHTKHAFGDWACLTRRLEDALPGVTDVAGPVLRAGLAVTAPRSEAPIPGLDRR